MTSNSPNKDVSASETTSPRTPGARNAEADAVWHRRMEDDNAFLHNQVATIQNAMELLLTRLPQPTVEQPFMPRREGAWIVDGQTTFVPPASNLQNPF